MESTNKRLTLRGLLIGVGLVCLALGWINRYRRVANELRTASNDFYTARKNNLPFAYSLMSPDYRKAHSFEQFTDEAHHFDLETSLPRISISISTSSATLFQSDPPIFDLYSGPVHEWVRAKGKWYFTGQAWLSLD